MNEDQGGFANTIGCWAMAAGAGALSFVLLLMLGATGLIGAIFLAGVVFAGLGLFFQAVFLTPLPAPGTVRPGEDRGLRAVPPEDPAATSVTYAAAKRAAAAKGEAPPPPPGHAARPAAAAPAAKTSTPPKSAQPKSASSTPAPQPAAAQPAAPAAEDDGTKPATLDAPRDGKADDLKKIKGVGPKLEDMLNSMGFYHFDQIAAWTDAEVAWVDGNVEGVRGRVSRDDWVGQARALIAEG